MITYTNPAIPTAADRLKLQLGVPSYGRDWGRQANSTEICPDGALTTKSIELQNMPALIDARGATPSRSTPAMVRCTFTYDVVATGYSTKPIPPPPFVPPHATQHLDSRPGSGATSGLQPALRSDAADHASCRARFATSSTTPTPRASNSMRRPRSTPAGRAW